LADVTHTPTESLEEDELWEDYELEENHPRYGKNYSQDDDVETYKVGDDVAGEQMVFLAKTAMNYLQKVYERGDVEKPLMLKLRRMLKALIAEAQNEDIAKARSIAAGIADIANQHRELGDLSWEMNDAEGLAYNHLSGRPIVIFSESVNEEKCEKCGREGCTCGPDCDCEPVEEDTFAHDEDIPTGEYEICDKCLGDGCEACDHGLVDVTGQFKIPNFDDMMGEGISLDSIVESVLDEYRNQPKDYEMSDEELAAEIEDETSEFERDHIDKEIEDEELGLRFD
jgi:hypothetical protein